MWRRIAFYVGQARALERLDGVSLIGLDETSLRRGLEYITVVHDLQNKRLLFATEGRDHQSVLDFVSDLKAHGGDPAEVTHVCMDMSAAYAKGVKLGLPHAQISYDRFHLVAMALEAMDQVRRAEVQADPQAVRAALNAAQGRKPARQLLWAMRRNPSSWSLQQIEAMHWLQRSTPKSARAWRLKMALREVYAQTRIHDSIEQAGVDLRAWLSWARRSRLAPFKKLAATLIERF